MNKKRCAWLVRRYCIENQLQCRELRKVNDYNNDNNDNVMYLNVAVNDQQ